MWVETSVQCVWVGIIMQNKRKSGYNTNKLNCMSTIVALNLKLILGSGYDIGNIYTKSTSQPMSNHVLYPYFTACYCCCDNCFFNMLSMFLVAPL